MEVVVLSGVIAMSPDCKETGRREGEGAWIGERTFPEDQRPREGARASIEDTAGVGLWRDPAAPSKAAVVHPLSRNRSLFPEDIIGAVPATSDGGKGVSMGSYPGMGP
jgi:hypothetical protein